MQTILHTAKRTFTSAVIPFQSEIIDRKCRPVRNVLPALPASLPSQSAQSDEDSSDSDDINEWESENDD